CWSGLTSGTDGGPRMAAISGDSEMKINWEWSGKRATRLGFLLLVGADIYYLYPDAFIYIIGVIIISLGFKFDVDRSEI
ncbi:hypothetical protein ACYA9B_06910, partial [Klebsiella pneumoniae]